MKLVEYHAGFDVYENGGHICFVLCLKFVFVLCVAGTVEMFVEEVVAGKRSRCA